LVRSFKLKGGIIDRSKRKKAGADWWGFLSAVIGGEEKTPRKIPRKSLMDSVRTHQQWRRGCSCAARKGGSGLGGGHLREGKKGLVLLPS